MDWVRLHLLLNHFPIILIVAGGIAVLAAVFSRRQAIWRYAHVTVLLAGLTAPAAFWTGNKAEEAVEDEWYVEEDQVEEHEEAGLVALVTLLAAGATAAIAWWRPGPALSAVFLLVTLGAAGVTGYTALEGGEIVHDSPALERGPPGGAAAEADRQSH